MSTKLDLPSSVDYMQSPTPVYTLAHIEFSLPADSCVLCILGCTSGAKIDNKHENHITTITNIYNLFEICHAGPFLHAQVALEMYTVGG